MGKHKALIVGATGLVGRAALDHLRTLADWDVVGLSRRTPDCAGDIRWVQADVTDTAACAAALSPLTDITHLVYTALYEEPSLVSGWTGQKQIDTNMAMLRNLLDPLERSSPGLRHITLLQGTKAYGVHHGKMKIPAKESDPRFIAPNFYYDQEDYLRARLKPGGWSFTVLRPQMVCGFSVGSAMNGVVALGVYAAVSRELGLPLRFPGTEGWVQQATDVRLLARAIAWAGTTPSCANEIFNILNGDDYSWPYLWPRIAKVFGMEPGPAQPCSLSVTMPGHAHVWDRIVAQHGLKPYRYDQLVPSWQYADFAFRHGLAPQASVMSSIKSRQHGFHDCVDTEDMFVDLLTGMQKNGVLPG